jgi:two-component system phosphate regulon sensor histidine kinase PhoR
VAVADVLEAVVGELRPAAEAKGLNLTIQMQARPAIMAQRAHLQSLWTHLVDNAIRYTPGGEIRVTLAEEDGQLRGTVSDTGIGVSDEEVTRIFQEFYRADSAREVVALGTGLGLPIVDQIVKLYGGSIRVDSAPGRGSTFTITLPLAAPGTGL